MTVIREIHSVVIMWPNKVGFTYKRDDGTYETMMLAFARVEGPWGELLKHHFESNGAIVESAGKCSLHIRVDEDRRVVFS